MQSSRSQGWPRVSWCKGGLTPTYSTNQYIALPRKNTIAAAATSKTKMPEQYVRTEITTLAVSIGITKNDWEPNSITARPLVTPHVLNRFVRSCRSYVNVSKADTGISVQAIDCRHVYSDPSSMAAVWLRER